MAQSTRYGIQHSQNFLTNTNLVRQLVRDSGIGHNDTVLEIGPGKGIITRALADCAGRVLAIEKDEALAAELSRPGHLPGNVIVLAGDVLEAQLPVTPFKVFANIPFRHTAAIIGKLTTGSAPPRESWLVVQREAADRYELSARNSMQAITLASRFDITIRHEFSRSDFTPQPNVDAVLMRISAMDRPLIRPEHHRKFVQFVDVVFSAWQQTLKQSIKARLPRRSADRIVRVPGIWWHQSVSTIPLDQWIRLFDELVALNDERIWNNLGQWHAKQNAERGQLDRPTRSRSARSRR